MYKTLRVPRTYVDAKFVYASTRSGSWSHIYEELRAITDAACVNLSKVVTNKGPYSSLLPNSSMTTDAEMVLSQYEERGNKFYMAPKSNNKRKIKKEKHNQPNVRTAPLKLQLLFLLTLKSDNNESFLYPFFFSRMCFLLSVCLPAWPFVCLSPSLPHSQSQKCNPLRA